VFKSDYLSILILVCLFIVNKHRNCISFFVNSCVFFYLKAFSSVIMSAFYRIDGNVQSLFHGIEKLYTQIDKMGNALTRLHESLVDAMKIQSPLVVAKKTVGVPAPPKSLPLVPAKASVSVFSSAKEGFVSFLSGIAGGRTNLKKTPNADELLVPTAASVSTTLLAPSSTAYRTSAPLPVGKPALDTTFLISTKSVRPPNAAAAAASATATAPKTTLTPLKRSGHAVLFFHMHNGKGETGADFQRGVRRKLAERGQFAR